MGEVTRLLERARDGDAAAWDEVIVLIYDDLKHIARHVLGGKRGGTLNPTGLVHECYLRLAKDGAAAVNDRSHFLALAARAMRQLMLNHAREKLAGKRGAGATHVELDAERSAIESEAEQLIAIDAALQRLSAEDERMVRVIECRVFAGLSEPETAEAMQLPLRSCQRLWADARARLETLMAA
jgi:RNA polymerase sigma factor (TIGR02999 family)